MPRLSRQDRARAREIEGILATLVDGAPPVLESLMPALRDYLDCPRGVAYGVSLHTDGCDVAFAYSFGTASGRPVAETMRPWIRRSRGRFGLYDSAAVDEQNQNRVVVIPPCLHVMAMAEDGPFIDVPERAVEVFRAVGILEDHSLRVLVTDGRQLLAWVGGFQCERVAPVQVARLRALVPALQRRLVLEARLGTAAMSAAVLPAILERVPSAVYVVSAQGHILFANAAGRALYDEASRETLATVRTAVTRGTASDCEVTSLSAAGSPTYYLVVSRFGRRRVGPRIATAARRHGLTPRETEVLGQLVQGASNRAIALELGCAERTVEVHVAHLLDKFGAPSRSALVARFWMDG